MICCIIHWQSHLMILDATTGKGQTIPTFPGYSSYGDMNTSLHLFPSITQILLPFFSQFLLIRPIWTKRGGSRLRPPFNSWSESKHPFPTKLKMTPNFRTWRAAGVQNVSPPLRSEAVALEREMRGQKTSSRPASKHSLNDCNSIRLNFMERLLQSRLSLGGLEEPRVWELSFDRQKPWAGPGRR